ncbi:UNVERIFIED_CONTAM: hypothetical protein H355_005128, partial [Colinus virginianus]
MGHCSQPSLAGSPSKREGTTAGAGTARYEGRRGITNPTVLQFEEVQAIIWHYKSLLRMHKAFLQEEQGFREAKQQANKFIQDTEDKSMQYKNELDQLKPRSHQARRDVLTWESRWADIQKTAAKKTLELKTIKMAILGLFQHVSKQMQRSLNVPVDDSYAQLNM